MCQQKWSERRDSNTRPLPPQGSALARLRYTPIHFKIWILTKLTKKFNYNTHAKLQKLEYDERNYFNHV